MGEGVKASVEVVNVALSCATPGQSAGQSAEQSLALVPPTHHHFSTSWGMETWAQVELCNDNCGRSSWDLTG